MNARFLELEITGRCYYQCRHCYGAFPRQGELPADKVKQIIDEAGSYFDCIIFSGGEPFLHPDLIELAHHAKDFVVFITTSGYPLRREEIEQLKGNVVLVFGLDGIGETHDRYRGKNGTYQALLNSLELTKERPKEIIVTLWKGVLPHIEEIVALAERYRALLHFNALIPVGRARSNPEILLSRDESEMVYEKMKQLREERGAFIVTDLYKVTEKDLEGIDLFCKERYSISPQGEVRPCEFHPYLVLGNVYQEPLGAIIERAKATDFIKLRDDGFRGRVRVDLENPFHYHTEICHALAKSS